MVKFRRFFNAKVIGLGLLALVGLNYLIYRVYWLPPSRLDCAKKEPVVVPPLTIWVHGTNFKKVVPHWLHCFIPACYQGRAVDMVSELLPIGQLRAGSQVIKIAQALIADDAKHFDYNHFYLFRWSGNLGSKEREAAAVDLYCTLSNLIQRLESEYGGMPQITIIAHSHGGNVALSLAQIYDREHTNFKVNRLILLACPVVNSTKAAVYDPLFTCIYSLYSNWDWIQVLDWQGLRDNFAGRVFPIAEKIKQASLQHDGRGLYHNEFKSEQFLQYLPLMLRLMDSRSGLHASIHALPDQYLISIHSNNCI